MTLHIICNERKGAVVTDIRPNIKTVLATEIPGEPCTGILCMMSRHPIGLMGVAL